MRLESPGGLDLGKLQVEWWWIADFFRAAWVFFGGRRGMYVTAMAWHGYGCFVAVFNVLWYPVMLILTLSIVLTYVLFYCHVMLLCCMYVCWLNKIQWCTWFYPFTPPIISHACSMHLAKAVSAARRKRFPHCKPEDLQEPVRTLTWFLGTCYFQSDVNSTKQATSNGMLSFFYHTFYDVSCQYVWI